MQYLTIYDGPSVSIDNPAFSLEHLGRLDHPYQPAHFRGNRFDVVIRDLSADAARRALDAVRSIEADGLPNYFDDQRFGSVGYSGQFIAHAWLTGDAERALELALAEANPSDRAAAKAQKAILRQCWGNWSEAKARLERSPSRSIVTYLVDHPTDFRGAFARMRRELRTLYFSAFQSHLWNLILARMIEHSTRPDQRITIALKAGLFPFGSGLDPDQAGALRDWQIPLPSSRNPLPEGTRGQVIAEVLAAYQLTWPDFRVRHLKDVFFSKGSRPALVFPAHLAAAVADDEMHRGKKSLRLSFELGKGSYATIMVKRITAGAEA
jgi:tRNA pseudouridine13 synthase